MGCRRLPLEEHPHPGGEREPVRAVGHQQEGVQEDTGGGKAIQLLLSLKFITFMVSVGYIYKAVLK